MVDRPDPVAGSLGGVIVGHRRQIKQAAGEPTPRRVLLLLDLELAQQLIDVLAGEPPLALLPDGDLDFPDPAFRATGALSNSSASPWRSGSPSAACARLHPPDGQDGPRHRIARRGGPR